ncbi:MAG TPA: YkgJ family cysteine cluster protein [Nitrospira sp.]|nr:YkgJ family cysteine cluster protein [Nitrospira sp.]
MPPQLIPLTSLREKTDQWFQRAAAALLGQLPCRPGCSACCIGPFPITMLDAVTLQEGVAQLPAAKRDAVVTRAAEQIMQMEAAYPLLRQTPYLDGWRDADIDRLVEQFRTMPCPALGHEGRCELYEHRPLVCRSMGIPTEEGGTVQGACPVQNALPVVRLPAWTGIEGEQLAEYEAQAMEACRAEQGCDGEEVLLPYGFLPVSWSRGTAMSR